MSERRIDIVITDKIDSGLVKHIALLGQAADMAGKSIDLLQKQLSSLGVNNVRQLATTINQLASAHQKLANTQNSTALSSARVNTESAKQLKIGQDKLLSAQRTNSELLRGNKILIDTQAANDRATLASQRLANSQQQASKVVEKHTGGWIKHIATVAGGIIVYQGIREAMRLTFAFFENGVKAVSEYEDSVINLAAMWTTLSKDQSNIPLTFKNSVGYAKELIPVLQKIDQYTVMNLNELIQMTEAFSRQGVVMDINNQKQIQGYTNISNALMFLTRGQATSRQIAQEIKAVVEGTTKATDALSLVLNAKLNGKLKENIQHWKEIAKQTGDSGYVIEKIGEQLTGYTQAMDMMKGTWSTLISSLKTTWDILSRDIFTPILQDWKKGIEDVNSYLREHKQEISDSIQNGWYVLRDAIKMVSDNALTLKIIVEGLFAYEVMKRTLQMITYLGQLQKVIIEVRTALLTLEFVTGGAFLANASAGVALLAAKFSILAGAIALSTFGIYKFVEGYAKNHPTFLGMKSKIYEGGNYNVNNDFENEQGYIQKSLLNINTQYTPPKLNPGGTGDESAAKIAEKRVLLVGKWIAENDKLLNSMFKLADQREVDMKMDEYNIQLTQKKMKPLVQGTLEYNKLRVALIEINQEKKVQAEFDRIYTESSININKKYDNVIQAITEHKRLGKIATSELAAEENKARLEKEKALNPLYSSIKALEDEQKGLGKSADETARITYQTQILNTLIDKGWYTEAKGFIDENAKALYDYNMKLYDTNKLLRDNPPLWATMKDAIKDWGNNFASTMNDMVWGAKTSFKEILRSFMQMITKIIIETQIVKPLLSSVFGIGGTGMSGGSYMTSGGLKGSSLSDFAFAMGGIPNGITPFATGGFVTNIPTIFPMARGGIGIMSELGQDEAVMPLKRGKGGRLGVSMEGGAMPTVNVQIINNSDAQVSKKTTQKFDGRNLILTTVLEGVNTNENGFRDGLSSMFRR